MTIYTLPEPFETSDICGPAHAVAYRDGLFLLVDAGRCTFWSAGEWLSPPPPIPAEARKPQVGEVWVVKWVELDGPVMLQDSREGGAGEVPVVLPDGHHSYCPLSRFSRPATPAEAEPFRPLLEGLKRSLGETK